MTLFSSPAKVNLFFKVLRKRTDGYTEIVSLIRAISLKDTLTIKLSTSDQFTIDSPFAIPVDSSNLVIRALHLFRSQTKQNFHCKIHLKKVIPPGSGLGGGSSNAATTLWALNQLTHANIPAQTLMSWGSQLGMDVPFFFSQGLALCTGRGEIIENQKKTPFEAILAVPNLHVATSGVYRAIDFTKIPKENSSFFNHLEMPAFSLQPKLKHIKEVLLRYGFEHVVMTGSGCAFVCYGKMPKHSPEDISFYPIHGYTRENTKWYEAYERKTLSS